MLSLSKHDVVIILTVLPYNKMVIAQILIALARSCNITFYLRQYSTCVQ
jgi:hypothetical protein